MFCHPDPRFIDHMIALFLPAVITPALKPLSMFTTLTFEAQELSIVRAEAPEVGAPEDQEPPWSVHRSPAAYTPSHHTR